MHKNAINIVFLVVMTVSIVAGYFYWQHLQPKPQVTQVYAPPAAPVAIPKPEVRQVIEPAPVATATPLPQLDQSDSYLFDAMANLIGDKTLEKLLHTKRIIHNIVATIDNLPRRQVSANVLPIAQPAGKFLVTGKQDALTISPDNAARYSPYVRLAEVVDSKKLVELYVRLYPLFQQAYAELGYPKKYFNDRLLEVLDDLLAAPNIKEPIQLVQPSVRYKFADPDIEALSIGQRVLVRVGNSNEARIKAKLLEIKQELMRHLRETTVDGPG